MSMVARRNQSLNSLKQPVQRARQPNLLGDLQVHDHRRIHDLDVVGRRVGHPNQRRLDPRNQFLTSLTGVHDS
jgi:hypothetical protein